MVSPPPPFYLHPRNAVSYGLSRNLSESVVEEANDGSIILIRTAPRPLAEAYFSQLGKVPQKFLHDFPNICFIVLPQRFPHPGVDI